MTKPRSNRKKAKKKRTRRKKQPPVNLMPLIKILAGVPHQHLTIDEFLLLATMQSRTDRPLTRSYIQLCLKRSSLPPC